MERKIVRNAMVFLALTTAVMGGREIVESNIDRGENNSGNIAISDSKSDINERDILQDFQPARVTPLVAAVLKDQN